MISDRKKPCHYCEGKGYIQLRDCSGELQREETCSFCGGMGETRENFNFSNTEGLLNLNLRKATLKDRRKTYDWMYRSDTTHWHSGKPHFPDQPISSWDEFQLDFLDFYYSQEIDPKGGVWIIEINGIEIGAVCFASFHLNPYCAELDIWLKNSSVCGKGYGVKALREFTNNLYKDLNINYFMIRPARKNIKAIKAYQKAGFYMPDDVNQYLNFFIHELYKKQYLAGDYGFNETAVLIKQL